MSKSRFSFITLPRYHISEVITIHLTQKTGFIFSEVQIIINIACLGRANLPSAFRFCSLCCCSLLCGPWLYRISIPLLLFSFILRLFSLIYAGISFSLKIISFNSGENRTRKWETISCNSLSFTLTWFSSTSGLVSLIYAGCSFTFALLLLPYFRSK